MEVERFDALSRFIGSRTSRRMAAGLVAAGLLGMTVPEAAATKCSKLQHCPECKRCRRHRCKPDTLATSCTGGTCQSGTCVPSCGDLFSPCGRASDCCSGSCNCTDINGDGVCDDCVDNNGDGNCDVRSGSCG